MMESEQIRQMADAIIDVTGFVEGGAAKIYKHYNAVLGQSIIIYVSNDEPTRVLPLNVLWLDTNRDRDTYKQFVRRVAKVPSNGFRNTWELVTEFMRLFIAQSYDPQDGTPGVGDVGIATKDTAGLAKLTTDAKPITAPRFVAVDDLFAITQHRHITRIVRINHHADQVGTAGGVFGQSGDIDVADTGN